MDEKMEREIKKPRMSEEFLQKEKEAAQAAEAAKALPPQPAPAVQQGGNAGAQRQMRMCSECKRRFEVGPEPRVSFDKPAMRRETLRNEFETLPIFRLRK